MFHNAAWGVRSLCSELVAKIYLDTHKKNRYESNELKHKIERQKLEFMKMADRDHIPLLKSPE